MLSHRHGVVRARILQDSVSSAVDFVVEQRSWCKLHALAAVLYVSGWIGEKGGGMSPFDPSRTGSLWITTLQFKTIDPSGHYLTLLAQSLNLPEQRQ